MKRNCGLLPSRELGAECTHTKGQGFPSEESRVNRPDSCYTPCQSPHQGNDQDCNSLHHSQRGSPYIRQNCQLQHSDLQNSTEMDPRCVWPGYDSPPMDMEYGMVPLQVLRQASPLMLINSMKLSFTRVNEVVFFLAASYLYVILYNYLKFFRILQRISTAQTNLQVHFIFSVNKFSSHLNSYQ